jgi:transposase
MTMSTRRQFTPQQKLDILRRHLLEGVPVSDLCDEHQLNPNLFYRWQKQLFENGAAAFERDERPQEQRLQKKVAALQEKLAKKDEVIAEIMESHVQLKKSLGEA